MHMCNVTVGDGGSLREAAALEMSSVRPDLTLASSVHSHVQG